MGSWNSSVRRKSVLLYIQGDQDNSPAPAPSKRATSDSNIRIFDSKVLIVLSLWKVWLQHIFQKENTQPQRHSDISSEIKPIYSTDAAHQFALFITFSDCIRSVRQILAQRWLLLEIFFQRTNLFFVSDGRNLCMGLETSCWSPHVASLQND
jgi:hypothetical protein